MTPSVRLLAPLAKGGMGTVWIAEHLVLETHVVVKCMTRQVAGNPVGALRFAREAANAAAVKSPHVVQVLDSGVTEGGVAYIVMELLEGHDLGADLAAHGRMAPGEVAVVVSQLVKALASAHRAGVVHRDIKPENVFLCDAEPGELFVKLLDFGTAKDEARAPFATVAGELLGTPYYMSPEQLLGAEVDARADIWSLGVLAFEALTGTRPFEGVTLGAITLAIHTTAPRMTDVAADLPPALDDWFARACARDPAERFPTARAAGEAFACAMKGYAARSSERDAADGMPAVPLTRRLSVPGRPADRLATSLSSTLAPPRHEHRITTWAVAGAVAASVLGGVAFFTYGQPLAAPRSSPSRSRIAVAPVGTPSAPTASPSSPPTEPAPESTAAAPTPSPPSTLPAAIPPPPVATAKRAGTATPTPAALPLPRPATAPAPRPPGAATATASPLPSPAEPSVASEAEPTSEPEPTPEPEATPPAPTGVPEPEPAPPADLFRERQ